MALQNWPVGAFKKSSEPSFFKMESSAPFDNYPGFSAKIVTRPVSQNEINLLSAVIEIKSPVRSQKSSFFLNNNADEKK